jgi:hypothetical protein
VDAPLVTSGRPREVAWVGSTSQRLANGIEAEAAHFPGQQAGGELPGLRRLRLAPGRRSSLPVHGSRRRVCPAARRSGPRVPISCAHSLIGAAGWAVVIIEGCGSHVRASSE